MSHSTQADGADVRAALAVLVAAEPELPSGSADIERRGRRRLAQRRLGAALGAALVVAALGVTAVELTRGSGPDGVAAPPGDGSVDAGSQLAQGFPVGSAVNAVAAALPAGAGVGELPPDIAWRAGGLLDVPVLTAAGPATVTLQVVDGQCTAAITPIDALNAAELSAIATSVCAEWVATGSLPVIPGGPAVESPDLASQ